MNTNTITVSSVSHFFVDGLFVGSLDVAVGELDRNGCTPEFITDMYGTVCVLDIPGLRPVKGGPRDSAREALKAAIEAAYATAVFEEIEDEEIEDDMEDDVEGLLSQVDLTNPASILAAADLATRVLARLVKAAGQFA